MKKGRSEQSADILWLRVHRNSRVRERDVWGVDVHRMAQRPFAVGRKQITANNLKNVCKQTSTTTTETTT